MSQTSYALTQSAAYEGARGDSRPADILPARNVSGGELPFGRFVKATTDSQGVTVLGASSDVIKGVTVLTAARMPRGSNWVSGAPVSTSATGIQDGAQCDVLSRGTVWMIAEEALAITDTLFTRYDASGATGSQALGRVRNDADTSTAVSLAGKARLMTTAAAAGDLVLVEVNIP